MSTEQEVNARRKSDILSLHRYFIWSNRMRVHFDQILQRGGSRGDLNSREGIEEFLYLSYWYGGLHVVIEGWQKLDLHDPDVDRLLDSPNVGLLRRYRNGAFHYQSTYLDGRFVNFFAQEGTAGWVRELTEALSTFFLRWARQNKQDLPSETKS